MEVEPRIGFAFVETRTKICSCEGSFVGKSGSANVSSSNSQNQPGSPNHLKRETPSQQDED